LFTICNNIILQTDADKQISEGEKRKLTLAETRRSLPVYKFRDAFIDAVREHQVLIVEGDTGSGKTTQLTQYLYESVSEVLFLEYFLFFKFKLQRNY
jgi:HrpA-like RNA helicase